MSEAHSNQMLFLLGFIGLLFLVVIVVIALSQSKKRKSKSELKSEGSVSPARLPEAPEPLPTSSSIPTAVVAGVAKSETVSVAVEAEPNLHQALRKTEENFFGRIRRAFSQADKKAVLEEVEEVLYTSDLGPTTVQKLLDTVESELSGSEMAKIDTVKSSLRRTMLEILEPVQSADHGKVKVAELLKKPESGPFVLMVVGVNGAGKTTSIGKITAQLASQNYRVLVAAGDTFRAAAGGQLKTWTDRASNASSGEGAVEIYWPENTKDPSAVAFDAVTKAKSQGFDFVILDTAGRLHTQAHLMDELKKVKRVMAKVIESAPHETWIVLDANSGQNALMQAKEFHQALGLNGVVLTKMDGTAKGGVALGVVDQIGIPVKLVGIGEKINHLKTFDYSEYVDSILGHE
ncbi:signal recognition particle-docking protein FtsY [Pseudobdellovibrio exovorus]|uniref:Signal recognition particle-docking protein FtsY n=1 Tax=Pseudobdellovibrio exovorus JSS TaxID=1184267 RepID=M4VD09_9BACT|nr:signal recognition particle-docking protein FtsY [Pseudobdellovibrio exovorus]AGH95921.1 signal recognition particle-docking protein FtsY [Pseudobdellovibrio exovorus JSS]